MRKNIHDRRSFLKFFSSGVLCSLVFQNSLKNSAFAQSGKRNKFILYIHAGSWDGWASGLLQPTSPQNFPRGAFRTGVKSGSANWDSVAQNFTGNPLIDKHYAVDQFVFHTYSNPLSELRDHLCMVTGNAESLGHTEAQTIRATGAKVMGTAGNPSWISGLAQCLRPDLNRPGFILGGGVLGQVNFKTTDVSVISSLQVEDFRAQFTDSLQLAAVQNSKGYNPTAQFMGVLKELHREDFGSLWVPTQVGNNAGNTIDGLIRGVPELAAGQPAVVSAEGAINRAVIDSIIDTYIKEDFAAVKSSTHKNDGLMKNLQLAAALAKTGLASGMAIGLDGGDYHSGGSSVLTARSAGQMWAQITAFWRWVKSQQLERDVVVIVSHDFSRTPFNAFNDSGIDVMTTEGTKRVLSPGTDHHLVMGMAILHGAIPKGRLGGVADSYTATGSRDLNGTPDVTLAPWTQMQILGSVFMKIFPQEFPTARDVRKYWPQFKDEDVIDVLLR